MRFMRPFVFCLAAAGVALAAPASAQYPSKPLRIVVPFTPGGATDLLARALGQRLSERWGQPSVVDNKPGGATIIGIDFVAKAPADGHTLLLGSNTLALNRLLYKSLPYDVDRDITPVVLMTKIPNLIVVNAAVPAKTLLELIALAKAQPDKLNYASTGLGAAPHLFTELFLSMTGVRMHHVPYQGTPQAEVALLGDQVQVMVMNMTGALPLVRAGKLRALGVTTTQRAPLAPEIPTMAEAGLPGYEAVGWFGVAVRSGTPPEVVTKLNTEINSILRTEGFRKTLAEFAGDVQGGSAEDFAAYIRAKTEKWGTVVRAARIQPN